MADMNAIVEQLSGLTVLEVAGLVKQLEEQWGASAAAPVAMAAMLKDPQVAHATRPSQIGRLWPDLEITATLRASANSRSRPGVRRPRHIRGPAGRGP